MLTWVGVMTKLSAAHTAEHWLNQLQHWPTPLALSSFLELSAYRITTPSYWLRSFPVILHGVACYVDHLLRILSQAFLAPYHLNIFEDSTVSAANTNGDIANTRAGKAAENVLLACTDQDR